MKVGSLVMLVVILNELVMVMVVARTMVNLVELAMAKVVQIS